MIIIYAHTTNDSFVCCVLNGMAASTVVVTVDICEQRETQTIIKFMPISCAVSSIVSISVPQNVSHVSPCAASATSIAMANIIVVHILHISLMISTSRVHTHTLLLHWFTLPRRVQRRRN